MKKIVLLFLFLCLATTAIVAQNNRDVVYLKNGSIIKGVIVEQVPEQQLTIQTADGGLFVIKIAEIEKITKENISNAANTNNGAEVTDVQSRTGYMGMMRIGQYIIFNRYNSNNNFMPANAIEITTVHGSQIDSNFGIGGGFGMIADFSEVVTFPAFVHFRYLGKPRTASLLVTLNVGSAMGFIGNENNLVTLFLASEVGVMFRTKSKRDFLALTAGFQMIGVQEGTLGMNITITVPFGSYRR